MASSLWENPGSIAPCARREQRPQGTELPLRQTAGHHFLALDSGAESGRAMPGALDGGQLTHSEVHQFLNMPGLLPDGLHWDVLRLWPGIQTERTQAARKQGLELTGIRIDTQGVGYVLLDRRSGLVSNPIHYRDGRTVGMMEETCRRMPRGQISARRGIQPPG